MFNSFNCHAVLATSLGLGFGNVHTFSEPWRPSLWGLLYGHQRYMQEDDLQVPGQELCGEACHRLSQQSVSSMKALCVMGLFAGTERIPSVEWAISLFHHPLHSVTRVCCVTWGADWYLTCVHPFHIDNGAILDPFYGASFWFFFHPQPGPYGDNKMTCMHFLWCPSGVLVRRVYHGGLCPLFCHYGHLIRVAKMKVSRYCSASAPWHDLWWKR